MSKPGFLEVKGSKLGTDQIAMIGRYCLSGKNPGYRGAVHCTEIDGKIALVATNGRVLAIRFTPNITEIGFELGMAYFPKKLTDSTCWFVEVSKEDKFEGDYELPVDLELLYTSFKADEGSGDFRPSSDIMPIIKLIPNGYYIGASFLDSLSSVWSCQRDTDRMMYVQGNLYVLTTLNKYDED